MLRPTFFTLRCTSEMLQRTIFMQNTTPEMINRTKKVQNNTSEGPNYDQKGASEHLGDHIFYLIGASESKKGSTKLQKYLSEGENDEPKGEKGRTEHQNYILNDAQQPHFTAQLKFIIFRLPIIFIILVIRIYNFNLFSY